jgi:hypothetical protein
MEYDRIPRPLTDEEINAIVEEIANPPKDTPERRAMFKLVHEMEARRKQLGLLDPPLP